MDSKPPRFPPTPKRLLNLALGAQSTQLSQTSYTAEPDPENRRWLQEALSETFEDPVKRIIADISLLRNEESDASQTLSVLEDLIILTESIDYANDFHKCGGFPVLRSLLESASPQVRRQSAELCGQLVQNNPYCQEKLLQDQTILPRLMEMLETDEVPETRESALLGVSALLRSNESDAQKVFSNLDGLSLLLRSMQTSPSDRFQTRAAFLINCICGSNPEYAEELGNMGIVQTLFSLLQREHEQSHEQLMAALEMILKNSQTATLKAKRGNPDLSTFLKRRMREINGQAENEEEYEAAERILTSLVDPRERKKIFTAER